MRIPGQCFVFLLLTVVAGCTYNRAPEPYASPSAYDGQVISSAPYIGEPAPTPPPPMVDSGPVPTNAAPGNPSNAIGSDSALALRVQQRFQASEIGGIAPNINVYARNGTVTLTGFVPSERERQFAGKLASNAAGVLTVNNELQVVGAPTGRAAQPYADGSSPVTPANSEAAGDIFNLHVRGSNDVDRALAQRVLAALRANSALMATFPAVNIDISNGRAILQGQVQTEQQRQNIESAVRHSAGVSAVEDDLQILGAPPSPNP